MPAWKSNAAPTPIRTCGLSLDRFLCIQISWFGVLSPTQRICAPDSLIRATISSSSSSKNGWIGYILHYLIVILYYSLVVGLGWGIIYVLADKIWGKIERMEEFIRFKKTDDWKKLRITIDEEEKIRHHILEKYGLGNINDLTEYLKIIRNNKLVARITKYWQL